MSKIGAVAVVTLLAASVYAPAASAQCFYRAIHTNGPDGRAPNGLAVGSSATNPFCRQDGYESPEATRLPANTQAEKPLVLIDGSMTVARRFAPPATTAPQPGLFSVDHNIER